MSELTKRIFFAIPGAAFFIYLTWLGSYWFVGLIILLSLFIQRELSMLSESAGFKTENFFPYTMGLWILLTPYLQDPLPYGIAIFLLFIVIQILKPGGRELQELISTFFCGIYAPLGFLTLLLIRSMGSPETGLWLTISLLLMVWGNDVFAYFGGKAFGKNLFAPTVSPNKTWEGFFFGILGAFVGLWIAIYFSSEYPTSLLVMAPATFFISTFGPVGDLTASRFKRSARVKDASDILPGHGGFFDRFDALILATPAFYLYLYVLKILGYVSF